MSHFKTVLILSLPLCFTLLTAFCVSAAIYKYVDETGAVRFSDKAPTTATPTTILSSESSLQSFSAPENKRIKTNNNQTIKKSQPAITKSNTKYPRVELFVTSWCGYCKKAKAFLNAKGIPYTVYDIEKDKTAAQRKQQLSGRRGVPFALIGNQKISGYSPSTYARALGI